MRSQSLQFYTDNPRMLPEGSEPVIVKREMRIAPYRSSQVGGREKKKKKKGASGGDGGGISESQA